MALKIETECWKDDGTQTSKPQRMRALPQFRLVVAVMAAFSVAAVPDAPYDFTDTVVVEAAYDHATGLEVHAAGNGAYIGLSDCDAQGGCIRFPVRSDYRMFDLEVVDDAGGVVHAASAVPGIDSVCGTSKASHLYEGLDEIAFFIFAGTCEDGATVSAPTSGTVRITFYASEDPWCMGC